mgnify:CR=1 FL=1
MAVSGIKPAKGILTSNSRDDGNRTLVDYKQ